MAPSTFDLTVVIPTYDRRDRLRRVLDALGAQRTVDSSGATFSFEVIVVSDGSTDGTREMLDRYESSYELVVFEQTNAGPAAARNRGIEAARGGLVVFIDDDVIPEPGCLAAHVAQHGIADNLVVTGPMLTPTDIKLSPWVAWEQHQLEKQYRRFEVDRTAYPRQFYTGNASTSRAALVRSGGFDTSLRRAEDVELAQRLADQGQQFVFEPNAEAYHYADRPFASWRNMAADYGRNDIEFAVRGHPEVAGQIPQFFSERHPMQRSVVNQLIPRPRLALLVKQVASSTARFGSCIGLRRGPQALLSIVYGLDYYGGVAEGLGGSDAFARLMDGDLSVIPEDGVVDFVGWFVLEQTLGHVTHGKNLRSLLPDVEDLHTEFVLVDDSLTGRLRRLPGWTNWTVRAGLRARAGVRRLAREGSPSRPDAMFVHSQVPAVLLGRWMRIPTVVSLDATPLQYDTLGEFYAHDVGPALVERLKTWANRRSLHRARHIITWSEWAKQGVVEGYGVAPDNITVIAPGVDVDMWESPPRDAEPAADGAALRVLFVGGDLRRKGGDQLLEVAARLRADDAIPDFEIHLVTPADVSATDGIVVHAGLSANSPELIEQYHRADIFCLPTLGDCLPMVLAEAGASGLPLISTDVGAIGELVRNGITGRLIEAGNTDQLEEALRWLLTNEDARARCGAAALGLVRGEHDARRNAQRIVDVLRSIS